MIDPVEEEQEEGDSSAMLAVITERLGESPRRYPHLATP